MKAHDPVNQPAVELSERLGYARMGILKNFEWYEDPRRFMFSQSRYKFVAKMLSGRKNVLEIGCGDAFNAPAILQEVDSLTVTDFDPVFIEDARERMVDKWTFRAEVHDFLTGPMDETFDAAFSLDVLEHIDAKFDDAFITNICKCLTPDGVLIVGMPSLESQAYASAGSKVGHINCKSAPDLKVLMEKHLRNVFMFFMNDEVVHTGHHKMAHYILALCCGPRISAP